MNATVVLLQNPNNEFGKTVQLRLVGIQQAVATLRALCEDPAKQRSDVYQKHTQGYQEKTVCRVGRRSPAAKLASATVADFDTKTLVIQATHLLWGHIRMDKDQELPGRATF